MSIRKLHKLYRFFLRFWLLVEFVHEIVVFYVVRLRFCKSVHVIFWVIQHKFSLVITSINNLLTKEIWLKDEVAQTIANWGHRPCHDAVALSVGHSEPAYKVQSILPLDLVDTATKICLKFGGPLFTYAATKFGYLSLNQCFPYILRIMVKFRIKHLL